MQKKKYVCVCWMITLLVQKNQADGTLCLMRRMFWAGCIEESAKPVV